MSVSEIISDIEGYLTARKSPDYVMLYNGIKTIDIVVGKIIGALAILILIGIPIVVALEVMYINFPLIQNKFDDLYNKLDKEAQKALGLVIRDARKAVKDSQTSQYGAPVNLVYLKLKFKAVLFSIFLVAMVLGPGKVLISLAINFAQQVISAIQTVL